MLGMRTSAFLIALAAAALIAVPTAFAAQPKLYRVSMSGKDTADVTKSWAVPPLTEGCTGTVTETRHITSSFGVAPAPDRAFPPERRFGTLHFRARLTAPRYSYRLDTSGSWGTDPSDPYAPDPSACAFTHEHRNLKCRVLAGATSRRGVRFMLIPVNGTYRVNVNRIGEGLLNCERNEGLELIDHGSTKTKLTRAAVERLAPGKRVRVSGTIVTSHDYDNDEVDEHHRGRERFKYTLTVRRVR